jgi:hypothetical protein
MADWLLGIGSHMMTVLLKDIEECVDVISGKW